MDMDSIDTQKPEQRPLQIVEAVRHKKKIPGELRQKSLKPKQWLKSRLYIQIGFVALCLLIGWEFYGFVDKLKSGLPVSMSERPPGVEAFLPISSLMELYLWLKSGIVLGIHPAGVVLLAFAIGTAFIIRRGFCSWLCPVGTISEALWRLGGRLGINWKPWKWMDIPLRGLKYFLLGFFLYAILGMSTEMLAGFLHGGYNKVSDIKMLNFFIAPSSFTLKVLGILALLSLVVKNAWCRYLCPYGALLGIFSWLSPMKIRRDAATCIDCDKCTKACPSFLPVATAQKISSAECLACQQCTAVCPVKNCLTFSLPKKRWNLKPAWYGAVFVAIFLGSVGIARIFGYWQSSVQVEELRGLVKQAETLGHPRSLSGYKEMEKNH